LASTTVIGAALLLLGWAILRIARIRTGRREVRWRPRLIRAGKLVYSERTFMSNSPFPIGARVDERIGCRTGQSSSPSSRAKLARGHILRPGGVVGTETGSKGFWVRASSRSRLCGNRGSANESAAANRRQVDRTRRGSFVSEPIFRSDAGRHGAAQSRQSGVMPSLPVY
jgi:hypothetical protein